MTLDLKNFWNLDERDFYQNSNNQGADYYNSYSSFVKNSKTDQTLKNFKYSNPFSFIPSYGSTVNIAFVSDVNKYGNSYFLMEPRGLNRLIFSLDLNFENRSDDESDLIIKYINEREGALHFPFQTLERVGLSQQDAYKSLYSMKPYMVQDFTCSKISSSNNYVNNNSINLQFDNTLYSQLNSKQIIYSESLPSESKNIIEEYWNKGELDIQPSYSLDREEIYALKNIQLGSSRTFKEKNGINNKLVSIDLKFNAIKDDVLLKLLAFFISKQGFETFQFQLEKPEKRKLNFYCSEINHTFLYMDSHDLNVRINEVPVRRRFFHKP